MTENNARVLAVSQRLIRPIVSSGGGYEFEDVIGDIDDLDLVLVESEERKLLPREQGVLSRIRRRTGIDIRREPRRRKIRVDRPYELFFVRVMSPSQLDILESVEGWQQNCRMKVCWVEELWPGWIEHSRLIRPLRQFDHVFVAMAESRDPLARAIDRPCSFMPAAVDALRFCPYPEVPTRCIDFYSMGRRSPVTHQNLLAYAKQRGDFTYLYDSALTTTFVEGPAEHRELLASLIKRSRYFLANRAKPDMPEHTQGAQVFGPRFFEGGAAGAILVGAVPESQEFHEYFDWTDALIPVEYGSTFVGEVIDALDAEPERVSRARRANVTHALRRHDWVHRWESMLDAVGLSPLESAKERRTRLEERARAVESTQPSLDL